VQFDAVLFDFSGTLFHVESAAAAVAATLGLDAAHFVPELERLGAINGSGRPAELPRHLEDVWERRDLSREAHRAAYSGLGRYAGLSREQADLVYDRGVRPAAWRPFPDTVEILRRLHDDGVPVAVVSNIGWDPRPVLAAYGVEQYLPVLVLSDERGVMKPDLAIFRMAADDLDVDPTHTLMIGDNPEVDGAMTQLGATFRLVSPRADRSPTALLDAVNGR
jgi:putative hydrolase of the HAD superfamily